MSKNTKIVLVLAVVAVVIYVVMGREQDPITVTAVYPEIKTVEQTVSNTRAGTIDACRRSRMSPAIGGQIASLYVKEGDLVQKDQILIELWNKESKARVKEAKARVKAAERSAQQVCILSDRAQREAKRKTELLERGLASEEDTETAVSNAESQSAACGAALTQVEVNQASVEVIEASLERTMLIAPFDGIIAEIEGELGEYVTPSPVGVATKPTVDLIDSSCIYISAPIDEIDAPEVVSGMTARITMDAFGNQEFPATVRRVAPYVLDLEKQARTVEIEAVFDNPDQTLLPGYSADIEVIIDRVENTLSIPTQTIMRDNFVYVIDTETMTLTKKQIEVGIGNWQYTEVTNGLSEDDQVVLSVDREGVKAGVKVEVEKDDAEESESEQNSVSVSIGQ
ncbi:MAG TPA: efflux RND transporter periplasmic adaptor subunit [Gammaproteobacteria bacterium]|nr:efflux RND transporter periplasmic adaptor subunit [Gammaproteobacteria bacterium]